jgi:divalent metal cation (Fe/Co/Zn/Cd) transporter
VIQVFYEERSQRDAHRAGEKTTATLYSLLVALIFALVAILQIVRAVTRLPVTIGQTSIPIWVSWVACGVAVVLAWLGYVAAHS